MSTDQLTVACELPECRALRRAAYEDGLNDAWRVYRTTGRRVSMPVLDSDLLRTLLGALMGVQWSAVVAGEDGSARLQCPSCAAPMEGGRHAPDCLLGEAIADGKVAHYEHMKRRR